MYKKLTRKYITALFLISAIMLASHVIFLLYFKTMDMDGYLINISGRQRMLSQRISFLLQARNQEKNFRRKHEVQRRLDEAIESMETAHSLLTEDRYLSPMRREIYFGEKYDLDRQIRDYLSWARNENIQKTNNLFPTLKLDKLLEALNRVVNIFEEENDHGRGILTSVQTSLLLLGFTILFFAGIFIFKPMALEIVKTTENLVIERNHVSLLLGVTIIANESKTMDEAMVRTLEQICQFTGWPMGHAYVIDEEKKDSLNPTKIWYLEDEKKFQHFREVTEKTILKKGAGLPGRVLESLHPVWIQNASTDSNFPRNKVAVDIGVRSAFAFPVLVREKLVSVLEFFSDKTIAKDEALLGMVSHVGRQLGQVYERKKSEEEIQTLNLGLEQRVLERTQELHAEKQLTEQQANRLARSNEELQQFAYVASHDLQEPLRMVTSYLQLLTRRYKDKLDKDAGEYIHFAVDGAARMRGMINNLLEYSRVGTQGKELREVPAETVFTRTLGNLKIAIEEVSATVTHDSLPSVMADEVQLERLFQNLVGNAIKYRKKNVNPVVHVSVQEADGMWLFSIKDNGIGIEKASYERIFVIFQRLHTNNEYPGSGIGLSICRKIVERHGGRIWVESEPGQGSTFHFTLAQAQAQAKMEPLRLAA